MQKRILLVEDDATARTCLARLLALEGHRVTACASAEAVPEGADADVAILDLRLPGRWGDEVGRQLHAARPGMRVIFVTAEDDLTRATDAVPEAAVFRKPVRLDALLAAI